MDGKTDKGGVEFASFRDSRTDHYSRHHLPHLRRQDDTPAQQRAGIKHPQFPKISPRPRCHRHYAEEGQGRIGRKKPGEESFVEAPGCRAILLFPNYSSRVKRIFLLRLSRIPKAAILCHYPLVR